MASLAAELLDDDCLGIYIPETGYLRPYDRDAYRALKSDNPVREIEKGA